MLFAALQSRNLDFFLCCSLLHFVCCVVYCVCTQCLWVLFSCLLFFLSSVFFLPDFKIVFLCCRCVCILSLYTVFEYLVCVLNVHFGSIFLFPRRFTCCVCILCCISSSCTVLDLIFMLHFQVVFAHSCFRFVCVI